jgi:hypothetical protein
MMESLEGSKSQTKSIDQGNKSKLGKLLGVSRNQVNNFLRGEDIVAKHNDIDHELLMNYDNQTVKVSFDQNRQLLRGFCLLFKTQN